MKNRINNIFKTNNYKLKDKIYNRYGFDKKDRKYLNNLNVNGKGDNENKISHFIIIYMAAGHYVLYDLENNIAYNDIDNIFADGVFQQSYATIVRNWYPIASKDDVQMFATNTGWGCSSYFNNGTSLKQSIMLNNGLISIRYGAQTDYDNWTYDIITYPDGKSYKIPVK